MLQPADVLHGLDVGHKEKGVGRGCLLEKQIDLGKQKAGGKEEVV